MGYFLTPTASRINGRPGLLEDSLGQNQVVTHWIRVTPRLQIRESLELIGQLDILSGVLLGELAHDTSADQTPRDEYNGFSNIQPRWLFAQYRMPFGLVRIGQQPNHWGMGIQIGRRSAGTGTLSGDRRETLVTSSLGFRLDRLRDLFALPLAVLDSRRFDMRDCVWVECSPADVDDRNKPCDNAGVPRSFVVREATSRIGTR